MAAGSGVRGVRAKQDAASARLVADEPHAAVLERSSDGREGLLACRDLLGLDHVEGDGGNVVSLARAAAAMSERG